VRWVRRPASGTGRSNGAPATSVRRGVACGGSAGDEAASSAALCSRTGQRRASRGAARRARGLGGAHVAAARRVRPRPCAPCARARKRGEAQRGGAGGEAAVRGSGQPGSGGWCGGAPSTRSTRVDRLGGACRTSGGGGVRLGVSGAAWRAHKAGAVVRPLGSGRRAGHGGARSGRRLGTGATGKEERKEGRKGGKKKKKEKG